MKQNLLVELFVEELPPKALNKLGEAFSSTLLEVLKSQGLTSETSQVTAYASPRRLAAHISDVVAKAADKSLSHKLMPATVGLDANGKATPALLKKLTALGADESAVSQLKREHDGKADILFLEGTAAGATLSEGLQKALDEALAKLPIPKVMTYQLQDGWTSVNFVRPAHGLVALHGNELIPVSALGLQSGNTTQGHRFEAKVSPVTLRHADHYAEQLQTEGAVIASFAERRAEIVRQLTAAAAKAGPQLTPIQDEALLDEVTALVERPNVLLGQFEDEFLQVPQECLILTMKANQKYFPLLSADGQLSNKFLIVSNISPDDASAVIGGNERVVRPRLADAKFFFDQDRKKTLESRLASLDKVVYHNKLGSQGQRTTRVASIASAIGQQLGGDALASKAAQAARLAKADLVTDMVGEFPELQGIMGRYYAQHEGLDNDVAYAIEDHYKPRFAGDELPRNQVGVVVALADKLETLCGMFGIGQIPSGDKDPFALRRHALGVVRLLIENSLPLTLDTLLNTTFGCFAADVENASTALRSFIYDRLSGSLREQGYSAQEVDAVLALEPQQLADIAKRLEAVKAFAALPEAESLAAANKRVGNILKKAEGDVQASINQALLVEPAEQALAQALASVTPQADAAFAAGDYRSSLQALAALRTPVDAFFDGVMVNAEDPALKANRLGLLASLHQAMNRVADLSRLAG
ncbi:glycine--tRNA ligase subunit beta [Methylovorus glucosotrophus]|uniref:Glycine--tRNA ligase beta subunit n=1 Tax=Methylovorus glucosotrophus (strain SIP3-4) TaxID=582744 RepID=C6X7A4_METGS|nr:glycine--tRNA ligase subunit beta [Methylovorus glucosotrophus]ACT51369.1 glycyl-tRNA synthetase, beta subunit [Methylovorus glucosotrophus SIP3-4]